jgi:hypothetical protein
MRFRWRVFLGWAFVLTAVWVFANWPRDGGSLKPFLHWAGFPWTFAFWDSGRLEWFDPFALAGDVAVWAVSVTVIAGLCAWSRRSVATPERRG